MMRGLGEGTSEIAEAPAQLQSQVRFKFKRKGEQLSELACKARWRARS
jgi:hypothetical protein